MSARPPYFSVTLISASSLAYEILLMRLFAIIQWHHFAYMIIGLALLGYGISGTLIALKPNYLTTRYQCFYLSCLILFGLSAPGCFFLAQSIPFNAEEIFWDYRQAIYLAQIFILLTMPFFFAANALCLTLMHYRRSISTLYAIDLAGAGIGSLSLVLLLYLIFPLPALFSIGVIGLLAALIACWEIQYIYRFRIAAGIVCVLAGLAVAYTDVELNISAYKSLPQTLRIDGNHIIAQRYSPLGQISVVKSNKIPLRYAPGLSLNTNLEPLGQLGVFTDADNLTVITKAPEQLSQLAYFDQMTSALPYHMQNLQRVLIVGAGGGADVLQAKFHQTQQIDAIEMNPQIIALINEDFQDYSGKLYQADNINLYIGEARDYFSKNTQQYDLIQLTLLGAYNASTSGLYALHENYLYTTEALQIYYDQLAPGGYLVITRWLKIPPRDTLKLFATAIDALKKSGITSPQKQLALIRSWQTGTLLLKKGILSQLEIRHIEKFCSERSFDLAYTPAIETSQINRYNLLSEPYFHNGAISLISSNRADFVNQYKFNIQPATDDRPYFHHYFKWSAFTEILNLRLQGGMSLLESGYLVFIATLIIATLSTLVLIFLPLCLLPNSNNTPEKIKRYKVIFYFFSIGLAFLFIEIACIQKFILFLHHPIYATSITLTAFFVFAGLGSHFSTTLSKHHSAIWSLKVATIAINLISFTYLLMLDSLFSVLGTLSMPIKIICSLLLIAPLAFFMGMPFPLALANLSKYAKQLIPWAWGINGCASVISAVLATLLAIHFGFSVVLFLAMFLYLFALLMFPEPRLIK